MINFDDLNIAPKNDPAALPPKPSSDFRWATVVNTDPLVIRMDGESQPVGATPSSLVGALEPGNRVWVQSYGRALIVIGTSAYTPPEPPPPEPVWQSVTLLNGWIAYPNFATPSYMVRSDGWVVLRGMVRDGTWNMPIGSIPSSLCPDYTYPFTVISAAGAVRMDIEPDGDIKLGAGTGTWASLHGMFWLP